MPSKQLIEAIAVCAELTGTELSQVAAKVMAGDLARYPENQAMGALSKCRRELKGRMCLADVISRLDDGRPGVEEAWSMIPRNEYATVVWTEEMAESMDVVHPLLDSGDEVTARMAFKEKYSKLLQQARDQCKPVAWRVSLGYDVSGREAPLLKAVELGRLPATSAMKFIPDLRIPEEIGRLLK